MKVEILKQFSVFMPNRPGAFSGLARIFSDKGIEVLGLASEVRDDSGVVRIAVAPDADVSAILSQAGFSSVETNLISVVLEGKPGEMHLIAKTLAEGKINITTVYGSSGHGGGGISRILIAVENVQKAKSLLESLPAAQNA